MTIEIVTHISFLINIFIDIHGLGFFETRNIDATRQNPAMAPNI